MNRWKIGIPKKKIVSDNFNNHLDDIEMSGEKVSGIIKYGSIDNEVVIKRHIVFPMFRIQPNVTQSSYQLDIDDSILNIKESFVKVEIDGILHIHAKTDNFNIVHHFYPSTTLPIFYEQIEIENITDKDQIINYDKNKEIAVKLGCEGYIYVDRTCDKCITQIKPQEKVILTFGFSARFANNEIPQENDSYNLRAKRVNELLEQCDFSCGNDIIDTMFAFAKIRAGESIFNTRNGKIHSPGGSNYYAAIWCNDELEYANPWFGFTGDKILNEAVLNSIKWFEPYMNDDLLPIPSSIICEGTDYWNGAKDRGDASMFLYGTCRYVLETGISINNNIGKQLKWAYEYIKTKINDDNVVISDTDELEGRLSSGINLNTSSLTYGGLRYYGEILKNNNETNKAKECFDLADRIKQGIETYFGGKIDKYETYHYHKGCNEIRSWLTLPLYMGIDNRKDDTIKAINDKLWKDGSCLSTENENIVWDRSAMYYIATLFRCNYSDLAFDKLLEMSTKRLLGDRVPYAIEAYPEYNMRHLSAESALFCRIITDGLIHIDFNDGIKIMPHVPQNIKEFYMKNIVVGGENVNIYYNNGKIKVEKEDN